MKRRRYLVLAGAAMGLAGCSEGSPQHEPTVTSTATSTPAATEGPITETSHATATESPEPTETPSEPTDADLAAEHIDAAMEAIAAGVVAWEDQAGSNGEFLSVTAESEAFDPAPVWTAAKDAEDELDDAAGYDAEELEALIESVHAEYELLRASARAQAETISVREDTMYAIERFEAGRTSGYEYMRGRYDGVVDGLENRIWECRRLIDDVTAVDREYAAPYGSKLEQFEQELAIYRAFDDMFAAASEGWDTLESARSAMRSGEYNTAQFEAEDAENDFDDIVDDTDDLGESVLSETIESWVDALESTKEAARDTRREAAKQADAN